MLIEAEPPLIRIFLSPTEMSSVLSRALQDAPIDGMTLNFPPASFLKHIISFHDEFFVRYVLHLCTSLPRIKLLFLISSVERPRIFSRNCETFGKRTIEKIIVSTRRGDSRFFDRNTRFQDFIGKFW